MYQIRNSLSLEKSRLAETRLLAIGSHEADIGMVAVTLSCPVITRRIVVSVLTTTEVRIQALASGAVGSIDVTATITSIVVASSIVVVIIAVVVTFPGSISATTLLRWIQALQN